MKALLTLALFGIGAFAAPVPKEVRKQSPRDLLQGNWVIVSLDAGSGQEVQTADLATLTLTIAGDKFSARTNGGLGSKNAIATMVFDFSANPMRMDVKTDTGIADGIFKFEDGQLFLCHAQPGIPAPTEFKGANSYSCSIRKRAEK